MKYDIIIPCYNSHKTIEKTLASIVIQKNMEDLQVTLVNDAGDNYCNIIDNFSRLGLDINEISYSTNGGPAKARNFGRLNTHNEYLMFIDSDDVLSCPWSVLKLAKVLDNNKYCQLVAGQFMEENSSALHEFFFGPFRLIS